MPSSPESVARSIEMRKKHGSCSEGVTAWKGSTHSVIKLMGEARELEAGHVLLLSPKKGQDLEASGSTGGGV